MFKLILLCVLLAFTVACNTNGESEYKTTPDSVSTSNQQAHSTTTLETESALPSFVAFRNWQMGDPAKTSLIVGVYRTWDSGNTDSMATFFADSSTYDFPDGTRRITTGKTIEATFRKWRHEYAATSNIPFSLISLYNKDLKQEWVIAWTWNKWEAKGGIKDSALYCDNWRFEEGKITYLNSMENHVSKALAKRLNEKIPK